MCGQALRDRHNDPLQKVCTRTVLFDPSLGSLHNLFLLRMHWIWVCWCGLCVGLYKYLNPQSPCPLPKECGAASLQCHREARKRVTDFCLVLLQVRALVFPGGIFYMCNTSPKSGSRRLNYVSKAQISSLFVRWLLLLSGCLYSLLKPTIQGVKTSPHQW